ncbi:putative efflux protein, MATE family [Tindallia magadiensis]|uniref:Multidrug export protein MepA n=1 Tax=Tindallia magadiensis TaxID=69895 RepID=A0A1I3FF93_9FIRM|nr:MATE family efflux transporter [Tindallia magadiensis]SFI09860.1 putative efflux protein, MATE family [Tindallia magadiensis]
MSVKKKFFQYLVPSVSAMWFFSIYTMVDGMFVGRGVGDQALAAVNLAMPFVNTVFAIALLIAVGASTWITYYMGQGNTEKGNHLFSVTVFIVAGIGILITSLSLYFLDPLVTFLGATEETYGYVKDYLGIVISFSTFFMVAYTLEVLVKADGFPSLSITYVTLAAVINIVFDYLLVIRLGMGIKGAAYATGLAQFLSCIAFLIHFIRQKGSLKFIKPVFIWSDIKRILRVGFPESLTELSIGFTTFAFNFVIIRWIGPHGIAAFGVLMYLNNLVMMTMIGINQGMQPLVSYFNGKNDQESIREITMLSFKTVLAFSLLFFFISQQLNEYVVRLFISPEHETSFQLSVAALKWFGFGFLVTGFNVFISGLMTALKQSQKASTISFLRGYALVVVVLLLIPSILGSHAIWIAPVIYELMTLIIAGAMLFNMRRVGTI